MTHDLLKELDHRWNEAERIIVRVRVDTLLEQGELVAAGREWNARHGQPLLVTELRADEYVVDEELSTDRCTYTHAVGPFVDFVFAGGVGVDQVIDLARFVTPWSIEEKPELVLEPKAGGMEA